MKSTIVKATGVVITAGVLFFAIMQSGCYYDKADLVYPPSTKTCDTTGTTYSSTVKTILTANCYSCHSGTAASGGGIVLDTYTGLQPYVKNGHLLNDIKQVAGADAMPKGGAKMDDCSIAKIAAWVAKGAPNN